MLYRPEAFEPLVESPWSELRARAAIRDIVEDADSTFRGPRLFWQADEWDRWHGTSPMKNLYVGTAGVLWALDRLRQRDHTETKLDLAALATRNVELFRERPDYMKGMKLPAQRDSALLTGETGILLVAWRLASSRELADDLFARVRENIDNEAEEVMWGSPGTLFAAQAMLEWTGEERWRDAWNESANALLSRRDSEGYWTQRLYGEELRSLTPPHGVVGNVQALLPLLDEDRADSLKRESAVLLAGSSPGPRNTSTRSFSTPAPSLPGTPDLPLSRRDRASVTAPLATVMRSSKSSRGLGTRGGSSAPGDLRCTRSPRSSGYGPSAAAGATRCGPATSVLRSMRPTASPVRAAIPYSTAFSALRARTASPARRARRNVTVPLVTRRARAPRSSRRTAASGTTPAPRSHRVLAAQTAAQ